MNVKICKLLLVWDSFRIFDAMGAPKGNDFWKLRADMTADGKKLTVDQILIGAQEYIDRCVSEKLYQTDFKGKDATEVQIPHMILMSVDGLCHHLGINRSTWYLWMKDEKYINTLSRIDSLLNAYNLEGAGAGMINPAVASKLAGLVDKQENTIKGDINVEI